MNEQEEKKKSPYELSKEKYPHRFNLPMEADTWAYVSTMAHVCGLTKTQFLNGALREHMGLHIQEYDQARDLQARSIRE